MQATGYTLAMAARSHNAFAKATLLKNGIEQPGTLAVVSGKVSADASAAVRRRATGLKLRGYHPEVDPFNSELKLWRSVGDEYVALGVFRLEDPSYDSDENGPTTSFSAFDRAYWLSDLRLPTPYEIANTAAKPDNTLLHNAIKGLLMSRAPGLTYQFSNSAYRVPPTTFEEQSDPWEKALAMAEAGGMELFFDTAGVCVLRPIAGADALNVVATFGTDARILKASRKFTTKNTNSRAIVTGENTNIATPIRAEEVDDDPNSPTYYLGGFGDRPTWLRSQFITTQAQATAAAKALLARSSGRAESVRIDTIPNPAFDAGDVVRILHPEIGLDAIHVLDTLDIPLEPNGTMSASTRERRVA